MNLRQKDASTLGRTMGFALMVAFLSLGAISGCGSSRMIVTILRALVSLADLTGFWAVKSLLTV